MKPADLIPPAFLKPLVRLKHGASTRRYGSFAEAMKECGRGYDDDAIAQVVVRRAEQSLRAKKPPTHTSALRTATAVGMAAAGKSHINVLDFGGGPGGDYYDAKALFPSLGVRWHVVETPAMCRAAAHHASDELCFYDNPGAGAADLNGRIDLAFSNGALQCLPNPREWLHWFAGIGAENLALVRAMLTDGPNDVINVQRSRLSLHSAGDMPGGIADVPVSYPFTFCSRAAVEVALGERYDVLLRTEENENHLLSDALTYGFFCRLRR